MSDRPLDSRDVCQMLQAAQCMHLRTKMDCGELPQPVFWTGAAPAGCCFCQISAASAQKQAITYMQRTEHASTTHHCGTTSAAVHMSLKLLSQTRLCRPCHAVDLHADAHISALLRQAHAAVRHPLAGWRTDADSQPVSSLLTAGMLDDAFSAHDINSHYG